MAPAEPRVGILRSSVGWFSLELSVPGLIAGSLSSLCIAAVLARGGAVVPPVRAVLPTPAASVAKIERSLRDFRTATSERFVLVSDLPSDDAAQLLTTLERTADAVERFALEIGFTPRPLKERLVSVGFAERSQFERFARSADSIDATWMSGYWTPGADRTVFRLGSPVDRPAQRRKGVLASASACGGATVAHEAAHQLLHRYGVQRRSGNAPLWLAEGLATGFEPCGEGASGAFEAQRDRDERVRAAIVNGSAYPLVAFVATPRLPERRADRVDLFYDQAWSLARWLVTERHDAFAQYLQSLRDRARALNARTNLDLFERAFGPIADVEKSWRATAAVK